MKNAEEIQAAVTEAIGERIVNSVRGKRQPYEKFSHYSCCPCSVEGECSRHCEECICELHEEMLKELADEEV